MTHAQLVEKAVHWLRRYRCGVVLSEQACVSGCRGWARSGRVADGDQVHVAARRKLL